MVKRYRHKVFLWVDEDGKLKFLGRQQEENVGKHFMERERELILQKKTTSSHVCVHISSTIFFKKMPCGR